MDRHGQPLTDRSIDNPFGVTRAADFTDDQIHKYWVDLVDGGLFELVKPRSEMPMIIVGGKGSGKTHVMRYLSFPLQTLRHQNDLAKAVATEGYIGIYMRCSGLNSKRFRDKGQSDDVWASVFSYYMELWLAQLVFDACCDVLRAWKGLPSREAAIVNDVRALFDIPSDAFPQSVNDLADHFRTLQRELDVAINNCVIARHLRVTIRSTSGRLVFGIPKVLAKHVPTFKDCVFVYLIDELENLTVAQQEFINTLVREKEHPCSFKVGTRLYGLRTAVTYCADEENKEGSEYEQLPLDTRLRENEPRYSEFAKRLVIRRLIAGGIWQKTTESEISSQQKLVSSFGDLQTTDFAENETGFIQEKYKDRERPYFKSLRNALEFGLSHNASPGLATKADINAIVRLLSYPSIPLLEKLNCFLFYKQWSSRKDLRSAASDINRQCAL